jgi:hypothetical protein
MSSGAVSGGGGATTGSGGNGAGWKSESSASAPPHANPRRHAAVLANRELCPLVTHRIITYIF